MRDFFNILDKEGIYREKYHNKTDNTYKINKSKIEFFSADSPDRLRGARRDILFMNECNNSNYEAFSQLDIRTRIRTYLDFNPVQQFWAHDRVVPLPETTFIKSTYLDNEMLEPSIIRALENRKGDSNWWKVYGLGEVGTAEGLVFETVNLIDSLPTDVKWVAYGLDFGYSNDPTALIKVCFANGELWLDEVIYQNGLTNKDIADKMKQAGVGDYDEIIADSAEPKSIEEIRREGFRRIMPTQKGKDSILNGIDHIKKYPINVTKRSVNLIKEFRQYSWEKDNDGKFMNKPISGYDHGIDAIRYTVLIKLGKIFGRVSTL